MPLNDVGKLWRFNTIVNNQPGRPYRMVKWYGEFFKGYFIGEPYEMNEYEVEFEIGLTVCLTLNCEEPNNAIVKYAFIPDGEGNYVMTHNIVDVDYF